VTPQLSVLVDAALSKNPEDRFASAQIMIQALDDAFVSLDSVI
jgi:hypothetical protein